MQNQNLSTIESTPNPLIVNASSLENELSIEIVTRQVQKIQEAMKSFMKVDEHYGVIPGTKKPTLYKAGADKLGFMFKLTPVYHNTRFELPNFHREYLIGTDLIHQVSGKLIAQGLGSCSTLEAKYRYRQAKRSCPQCGKEAIQKSKWGQQGWYCYTKLGGCNALFKRDDQNITGQQLGQIENPDIADCYNTVLKMATKRSHTAAIITACAASDIFAQDLEDLDSDTQQQKAEELTQAQEKIKFSLSRVDLDNIYKALSPELKQSVGEAYQTKIKDFNEGGVPVPPPLASVAGANPAIKEMLDKGICEKQLKSALTIEDVNAVFKSFPLSMKDLLREEFVQKMKDIMSGEKT